MGKGQVSMEFLLIMGFAFLLIIPVIILFLTQVSDINEDVTAAQLQKLGNELIDSIDNVYYLGAPTKKTIEIYVPDFIESIEFIGNQIWFNVSTGNVAYSIIKVAAANITGSLNTNYGMHVITITAEANSVRVEG